MIVSKDKFQIENDAVLKKLIKYYVNVFKQETTTLAALEKQYKDQYVNIPTLELFITPTCNQNCAYCYLVKYGDKLYPKECNDEEIILKNLRILLDFFLEHNWNIPRLDLFSGEIWGLELGNKVFDILLEYIDKGVHIVGILIPSNFSFCLDKNLMKILQRYINKFAERNCDVTFSASIDGQVIDNKYRPFDKKYGEESKDLKTDDFYTNVKHFCTRNHFGYHPMVSANAIEYWIDNYKWWRSYLNRSNVRDWYNGIMFLEVRNDNWTDDKIVKYINWLNFTIDYDLDLWDSKIEYFLRTFCSLKCEHFPLLDGTELQPQVPDNDWSNNWHPLNGSPIYTDTLMNCSAGRSLGIRLGDFAIYPCHRTAYDKLLFGKLEVENDKIVDITALNPMLAAKCMTQGASSHAKCNNCAIKTFCLKGCWGSQFESTGDMFYPIESVCNLYHAKAIFQYYKTHEYIKKYNIDKLINIPPLYIDGVYETLCKENKEEVEKWVRLLNLE